MVGPRGGGGRILAVTPGHGRCVGGGERLRGMICDAAVAAIPRTPRGTVQRYLLTTPAPGRP